MLDITNDHLRPEAFRVELDTYLILIYGHLEDTNNNKTLQTV